LFLPSLSGTERSDAHSQARVCQQRVRADGPDEFSVENVSADRQPEAMPHRLYQTLSFMDILESVSMEVRCKAEHQGVPVDQRQVALVSPLVVDGEERARYCARLYNRPDVHAQLDLVISESWWHSGCADVIENRATVDRLLGDVQHPK